MTLVTAASAFIFLSTALFAYSVVSLARERFVRGEEEFSSQAALALEEMFLFFPSRTILALRWTCLVLFPLAGFFLTSFLPLLLRLPFLFLLAALGARCPLWFLHWAIVRRRKACDAQLVDGLTLIGSGLKAGLSLLQACELIVKEMPPPLSQELALVLRAHRMGVSLEQALTRFSERMHSDDLRLVVTAILISREVGGNLSEVFDKIASTIRERNRLKGKVDALTAQGRLQGIIVGLLPVVLGFILFLLDPDLMRPMLTTPPGWAALSAVLVLEGLGALMIKRIITIE